MIAIGHNLRWIADKCEWVIIASDPSKILLKISTYESFISFNEIGFNILDKHVTLNILHIENEPVFQKFIARLSNQSAEDYLRKIMVKKYFHFILI